MCLLRARPPCRFQGGCPGCPRPCSGSHLWPLSSPLRPCRCLSPLILRGGGGPLGLGGASVVGVRAAWAAGTRSHVEGAGVTRATCRPPRGPSHAHAGTRPLLPARTRRPIFPDVSRPRTRPHVAGVDPCDTHRRAALCSAVPPGRRRGERRPLTFPCFQGPHRPAGRRTGSRAATSCRVCTLLRGRRDGGRSSLGNHGVLPGGSNICAAMRDPGVTGPGRTESPGPGPHADVQLPAPEGVSVAGGSGVCALASSFPRAGGPDVASASGEGPTVPAPRRRVQSGKSQRGRDEAPLKPDGAMAPRLPQQLCAPARGGLLAVGLLQGW